MASAPFPTPIRNDWQPMEIWIPIASVFVFNMIAYVIA
jgi:hypothetical protein